ncbi:MAG: flagellin [Planctomycetota bacterium]
MSRINTNIPSLVAQRVLTKQNAAMNNSLFRLSTGYRINTGRDDPAGLIASENLRAEKTAIQAAITNISRANNVVGSAEGGLVEINSLLIELEDLVDRSANEAGISQDERNANQLQIDAILTSINRIASNTEFQGSKLLSGDLAYTTSGVTAASNYFQNVEINAARLPNDSYRTVTVEVTGSAQLGQLTWTGSEVQNGTVTIQVAGNRGTETLTFSSGTTITDMAAAINQATDLTGVSAFASTGGTDTLVLNSSNYGSSEFVSVQVLTDGGTGFATNLSAGDQGDGRDNGQDASVSINGVTAITDGLRASMRSQALSVDIDLKAAFGTRDGSLNSSQTFYITGGGANFMLSPTVSLSGMESLGIQAVDTGSLGDSSSGYLSSLATGQINALNTRNYVNAQNIIRAAQDHVSQLRGRLGAFQKNTLQSTANSLQITFENTAAAESTIRETDFASETSNMTRAQILVQTATNTLRLANAQPQNVLALLS